MCQFVAGLSLATLFFLPLTASGADPYDAFSVLRLEKKPAPDFSLPQVNGKTAKLSNYRGKAVLLGFFKTF